VVEGVDDEDLVVVVNVVICKLLFVKVLDGVDEVDGRLGGWKVKEVNELGDGRGLHDYSPVENYIVLRDFFDVHCHYEELLRNSS